MYPFRPCSGFDVDCDGLTGIEQNCKFSLSDTCIFSMLIAKRIECDMLPTSYIKEREEVYV